MEDITDEDYAYAKRVSEDFEIKNFGEYHDLYVQSDALLLTDVFENFRNMCLKIHKFDPAKFLSAPGLARQAALKKTKVKLDLLTEYVIHIRNLKQALNHGLVLKKVHKVIKFNQNAWLKPYIDNNTDLRKKNKK